MGQKVNPVGLRLTETQNWTSKWFAKRDYGKFLHEDIKVRNFVKEKLSHAAVSRIEIQRTSDKMRVVIWSARPGIAIGRGGTGIDRLREDLQRMTKREIFVDIEENKTPELSAELVSCNVAEQLVRRFSFRRAMKRAVADSIAAGASGIRICCAGRLGGAEMCRTEWYREGRVPLHTIRADIDYACNEAKTQYGIIGVKVWIYKGNLPDEGDRLEKKSKKAPRRRMRGKKPVDRT